MTWTAHCRVTDVDETRLTAEAVAGERVQPYLAAGSDRETDAVTSNTEGKIVKATLVLEFEGDAPLSSGAYVLVQGHFTA